MKCLQLALVTGVLIALVVVGLYATTASAGDDKQPQARNTVPANAPFGRQLNDKQLRWDYRVLDLDEIAAMGAPGKGDPAPATKKTTVQFGLNELGTQGWELCHASGDTFYFKRARVFRANEWSSNR
jgi:hypothetical protein